MHITRSDRIRLARRRKGLSQGQLAELLGVSRGAVANWEDSSPGGPALENMERLAKIVEVSFDWLATGRGEMNRHSPPHDPPAGAVLVEAADEIRMLRSYRAIPARARVALLGVAGEMAHRHEGRKKRPVRRS